MTNVRSLTPLDRGTLLLFLLITLLMGADLWMDIAEGALLTHLVIEALVTILAGVGAFRLVMLLRQSRRHSQRLGAQVLSLDASVENLDRRLQTGEARVYALETALKDARLEAARYREESRDALEGLSQAIDRQFEAWGLTEAERAVGLLLLKGLGHKEIGSIRGTHERTVRQQALALYRKAGLAGRHELSAWFLEDLLLPLPQAAHTQED